MFSQDLVEALMDTPSVVLAPGVRHLMETGLQADLSGVTLHRSPIVTAVNRALGTMAFTLADHIFLDRGAVATRHGRPMLVLAHELAHVVQKRLPVSTRQRNFEGAEDEAHAAARAVLSGGRYACSVPVPAMAVSCWSEPGHYYTTHFVLQAAGVPFAEAAEIAFFAQVADEVADLEAKHHGIKLAQTAGMAAAAFVVRSPGMIVLQARALRKAWLETRDIQRGLHCLTGSGAATETDGGRIFWKHPRRRRSRSGSPFTPSATVSRTVRSPTKLGCTRAHSATSKTS